MDTQKLFLMNFIRHFIISDLKHVCMWMKGQNVQEIYYY